MTSVEDTGPVNQTAKRIWSRSYESLENWKDARRRLGELGEDEEEPSSESPDPPLCDQCAFLLKSSGGLRPEVVEIAVADLAPSGLDRRGCLQCRYISSAIRRLGPEWFEETEEKEDDNEAKDDNNAKDDDLDDATAVSAAGELQKRAVLVGWHYDKIICSLEHRQPAEYRDSKAFAAKRARNIELSHAAGSKRVIPRLGYTARVCPSIEDDGPWAFVKRKFDSCVAHHVECRHSSTEELTVPKRLLHFSENKVYLVMPSSMDPSSSVFAALSYCWGRENHNLRLTTQSFPSLQAGILVDDLPVVFRDFFHTILRFDIQYAWIDAFCIMQDDLTDWEYHAAMMDAIYKSASLTIAVVSSENPSIPFLGPEAPNERVSPELVGPYGLDESKDYPRLCARVRRSVEGRNDGPLDRRAWTLQESQLPRRCIRVTSKCLQWSCLREFSSEVDPCGIPSELSPEMLNSGNLLQVWEGIIIKYTDRKLSFPSDRLAAISGLAAHYQHYSKSEYIAGLWRSRLAFELTWARPVTPGPDDFVRCPGLAPSFSWASIEGIILWAVHSESLEENGKIYGTIQDVHCPTATSNPYGSLRDDAFVSLSAPSLPARLAGRLLDGGQTLHFTLDATPALEDCDFLPRIDCALAIREGNWARATSPAEPESYSGTFHPVTLLLWCHADTAAIGKGGLKRVCALILAPSPRSPDRHQRIGLLRGLMPLVQLQDVLGRCQTVSVKVE